MFFSNLWYSNIKVRYIQLAQSYGVALMVWGTYAEKRFGQRPVSVTHQKNYYSSFDVRTSSPECW